MPHPLAALRAALGTTEDRSPWVERAGCRGIGHDPFFTRRGESTRPARLVCFGCPVKLACLDDALARNERFGIWGGMTTRERRKEARRRAAPVPAVPAAEESS